MSAPPTSPRKKGGGGSAATSPSMRKFLSVFKRKKRFSLEHLRDLCETLAANTERVGDGNRARVVEAMRDLAEVLLWGDQHDEGAFLELFLERNMLQVLLALLAQDDRDAKVQLIQTLSILLENVRDTNFVYCLLSNNHINKLIASVAAVAAADDDILAHYISFLKTLSLRLDGKSIHFFFNEQTGEFPLFTEAARLLDHRESMVRISVRVLALSVFRLDLRSLRRYLAATAAPPYFAGVCAYVRRQCRALGDSILVAQHTDLRAMDDRLAEITDNLAHVQDIFGLGVDGLSRPLCKRLLDVVVFPFLFASLVTDASVDDRIPPVAAVFMLAQVFAIFKYKPLVDTVADFLLHPSPPLALHDVAPSTFPAELQSSDGSSSNPFRARLLEHVGGEDAMALATECLFHSIVHNQVIDRGLLEEAGILPHTISKTKFLLSILTTGDRSDRPMLKTPRKPDVAPGAKPWRVHNPFIAALTEAPTVFGPTSGESAAMPIPSSSSFEASSRVGLSHSLPSFSEPSADSDQQRPQPPQQQQQQPSASEYLSQLVDKLLFVISNTDKYRVVTLQLALLLLKDLVMCPDSPARLTQDQLQECHAAYQRAIDAVKLTLGGPLAYIFLELFEEVAAKYKQVSIESLLADASVLLPVTRETSSHLALAQRLPADESEAMQKAIEGLLILRDLQFSLSRQKDDLVPLRGLPLPNLTSNQYFLIDPRHVYSQFTTAIAGKKVVVRYFVVLDGGLVILDLPLSQEHQIAISARRLSKPRAAIVQTIVPIQSIEIESLQEDILQVVCHQMRWSIRMGFASHGHMLEARHLLEAGRSRARAFKMKQIYKALGIEVEDMPLPEPPRVMAVSGSGAVSQQQEQEQEPPLFQHRQEEQQEPKEEEATLPALPVEVTPSAPEAVPEAVQSAPLPERHPLA